MRKGARYFMILLLAFACSNKETASQGKADVPIDQTEEHTTSEPADPEIALDFINAYLANEGPEGQGLEIREWVMKSTLASDRFKKELIELITQAWERDPEYGLGYDPLLMAQDSPEQFELSDFNSESGIVEVNGVMWKDFDLTLKVILMDGFDLIFHGN